MRLRQWALTASDEDSLSILSIITGTLFSLNDDEMQFKLLRSFTALQTCPKKNELTDFKASTVSEIIIKSMMIFKMRYYAHLHSSVVTNSRLIGRSISLFGNQVLKTISSNN